MFCHANINGSVSLNPEAVIHLRGNTKVHVQLVQESSNATGLPAHPSLSSYSLGGLAIVCRLLPHSHKIDAAYPDSTAHPPGTELKTLGERKKVQRWDCLI